MLQFSFTLPTRIVFGQGSLDSLSDTPHLPQGGKALVVISRGGTMIRKGYLARVQGMLAGRGVASIVYDRVRSNPESDQVDEAAAVCRERKVDFVVGLGGGSSIDSAKAIALMARNPGSYLDYMQQGSGGRKPLASPGLPVVAIPTTGGTGSEANQRLVITKSGATEKLGFAHAYTYPALSIVDPTLMTSVPPEITAHTGMDAFFHAVEAYLSKARQPITDLLALQAVGVVNRALPLAVADGSDLETRTLMAWAATAAGLCIGASSSISHHSIEHALSAAHPDLPHGAGLTCTAPAYFSFLLERNPDRFADLALAMERDAGAPEEFLAGMEELIAAAGLAGLRLSDYGVTRDEIPALARSAMETGALFGLTPVEMDESHVREILMRSYA